MRAAVRISEADQHSWYKL